MHSFCYVSWLQLAAKYGDCSQYDLTSPLIDSTFCNSIFLCSGFLICVNNFIHAYVLVALSHKTEGGNLNDYLTLTPPPPLVFLERPVNKEI